MKLNRDRKPQLGYGAGTDLIAGLSICANKRTSVNQSRSGLRRRAFAKMNDQMKGATNVQGLVRDGFRCFRPEGDGVLRQTNVDSHAGSIRLSLNIPLQPESKLPRRNSQEDYIVIPPEARKWDLSDFPFSARLKHILANRECRQLDDLHGLCFSRILRWRNMGAVSLRTLIVFVKSVQQGDWGLGVKPDLTGWPPA